MNNDDSKETVEILKETLQYKFNDILELYMNNLKKGDLKII